MSKEMTKEEALKILRSEFSARKDEAREFLQKNYPEVWAEYEQSLKAAHVAPARADENLLKNVEMIVKNKEDLRVIMNHADMKSFGVREFIAPVFERVDIYQKDEKTGKETLVSDASQKEDFFKAMYFGGRLEAEQALVQSKTFYEATPEQKKEMALGAIEDNVLAKIYCAAAVAAVEEPKDDEAEIGTSAYYKYTKRQADKCRNLAKDVTASDKRIKITTDAILLSTAATAAKTNAFSEKLRHAAKSFDDDVRQKLNEVAMHFTKRKTALEQFADKASNGRYSEVVKPVVKAIVKNGSDSIKDNIFKLGTSIAIAVGATVALKTGLIAAPALALGYGIYYGATSWIWPIVTETRKAHRLAKEANKPITWKEAKKIGKKNATQSKEVVKIRKGKEVVKKRNPYITRGIINSVLGVGGGILLQKVFKAKEAVTNVVDIAKEAVEAAGVAKKQQFGFRLFKSLTPSAAQLADAGVTFVTGYHDPNLRQRARWEAGTALIGAGISATILGWSEYKDEIKDMLKGIFGKDSADEGLQSAGESLRSVINLKDKWVTDYPYQRGGQAPVQDVHYIARPDWQNVAEEGLGDVAPVAPEPFPTVYSKDFGIEKWRFEEMMRNINNGKIDVLDPQALDRAYMNMDEEFMSNFEGKTKMQVFYDIAELSRNGRRHQLVLGNAEDGFFINTPTGRYSIIDSETAAKMAKDGVVRNDVIVDDGVIAQAKAALAADDKLYISRLHGREFLREQFENVNIEGMTDEKMSKAIEIAMETYNNDQVAGATAEIRELFPDMNKDQVTMVSKIVDYNRRFDENGEQLEQLLRAIGCDEKDGIDYEASKDLLNQREAILKMSDKPTRLSSRTPGCNERMTHILHVDKPVEEPKTFVLPEEAKISVQDTPLRTRAMPDYGPEQQLMPADEVEPLGRQYIAKNVSDHWNDARIQKTISDADAERYVNNQELLSEKPIKGFFKVIFGGGKNSNSNG